MSHPSASLVRLAATLLLLAAATVGAAEANPKTPVTSPAPEEDKELEEVQVIGIRDRASTEITPQTQQLLGIAGAANDPLQALYALPGVTFSTSDGPGGSEPVIRGSAPQDNAYFIDLIPASYLFHLFGNSIFDPHTVSSFDLYPAAFSSKYGNATGGIIDVTLREPKRQPFTTTLHTSLLTAGAMIESRLGDKQSFYGAYRRSTMDLLLDEDDIDADDEGFTIDKLPVSDDYQLKYSWRPNENNNISLVAAGASDTLDATFDAESQEALRDPDFAGPASIRQGFDSQGLIWDWRGTGRGFTGILSHIGDEDNLIYGKDQHENTASDRYLGRFFYRQDLKAHHSLSMGVSLEDIAYDLDFNAKLVACNDLDPECSTVDADYVSYQDTLKVFAHELYLEDRWAITPRQALTYGLHYSGDDYLGGGRIEPRLRYDFKVNDRFSTYLAAGQYSQLPQLREMIDVLGNPGLTTVKSDHFVLGVSQAFGPQWRWNADVYYKNMRDIVISASQDAAANRYSNGAEGSAYGIEFLLKKDLTDRWYGWAALSLSKSNRKNNTTGESIRFEYDKPILFNLVANRKVGNFWMTGLRWSYQSGGRYTPIIHLLPSSSHPEVMEPVYGALNAERLPAYHRLDLRAEYTRPKAWGYWKFYIDVLNAYNKKSVTGYEYAPNGKKLITPPPGYGADVPVKAVTSGGLFPSIGFEVQF